jgi:hypothetical protein
MTVVFLFVDIALMFNQYVNPVALTNIGWKYYIVYVRINGAVPNTQTYLKIVCLAYHRARCRLAVLHRNTAHAFGGDCKALRRRRRAGRRSSCYCQSHRTWARKRAEAPDGEE